MALGKLPVPGRPTIWMIVGQGPIALAVHVGAGGVVWTFLLSSYPFSPLSPSLWETARYRLKCCLKRAAKTKTNKQNKSIYTDLLSQLVSKICICWQRQPFYRFPPSLKGCTDWLVVFGLTAL